MSAKYKDGFLFGHSRSAESPRHVLAGEYDLALLAPSWDHRCESIAASDVTIRTCIVLRFTTKDEFGFQVEHAAKLDNWLADRCERVVPVVGDSVNLPAIWTNLWQTTWQIAQDALKPLRVLIDLTTCPRYYSLGFFAGVIKYGLARKLTVFYAEGEYGDNQRDSLVYPFTVGPWRATAIPFLRGFPDPLKGKTYVVSVGFEGRKTARVLAQEDPDRVALLFSDPAVKTEYVDKAWKLNKDIIYQYRIGEGSIARAPAGDAIHAWRALSRARFESPAENSTYYLCSGTKPHALGLALRALCMESATVMYNLPESHKFVHVHPSGKYWSYDLVDLTTPLAAAD